nr:hypothetical protein CFP56_79550 [Quercus suber]
MAHGPSAAATGLGGDVNLFGGERSSTGNAHGNTGNVLSSISTVFVHNGKPWGDVVKDDAAPVRTQDTADGPPCR